MHRPGPRPQATAGQTFWLGLAWLYLAWLGLASGLSQSQQHHYFQYKFHSRTLSHFSSRSNSCIHILSIALDFSSRDMFFPPHHGVGRDNSTAKMYLGACNPLLVHEKVVSRILFHARSGGKKSCCAEVKVTSIVFRLLTIPAGIYSNIVSNFEQVLSSGSLSLFFLVSKSHASSIPSAQNLTQIGEIVGERRYFHLVSPVLLDPYSLSPSFILSFSHRIHQEKLYFPIGTAPSL